LPELPDVTAFEAYLKSTALQKTIARVSVLDSRILDEQSPQSLGRRLNGKHFHATHRHGKFLFAGLSDNGWLSLHFGMTGSLAYFKADGDAPRHTRVALEFDNGYALAYVSRRMLGRVGHAADIASFVEREELGPDALDDAFGVDDLEERVRGRTAAIKSILMNQALIAGIGNVYADEILFHAGFDPRSKSDALSRTDVAKLHRTIRRVLRTVARKHADVDALPRSYLLPARVHGRPCPRCGRALDRVVVSGRKTYVCAACQRRLG